MASKHGVLSGAAACRGSHWIESKWLPRWAEATFPGVTDKLRKQARLGVLDLADDPRLAALLQADYIRAIEREWRRLTEREQDLAVSRATSVLEQPRFGMREPNRAAASPFKRRRKAGR